MVCVASPSSISADAGFGLAELDHRPAAQRRGPLELLRDAVAAAEHGQLLARFERLARRPAGRSVPSDRRAARRRAAADDRAPGPAGRASLQHRQPLFRIAAQQERARELAAAEDPRLDAGLPHPRAVERPGRAAPGRASGGRARLRDVPDGTAPRPIDHSPIICRCGSPSRSKSASISSADLVRDRQLARDDVMRREADQRRDHAGRIVDLAATARAPARTRRRLRRPHSPGWS